MLEFMLVVVGCMPIWCLLMFASPIIPSCVDTHTINIHAVGVIQNTVAGSISSAYDNTA